MALDGTVDSSPIYLHGVTVHGKTHDVFFVTTTYGKTEALDASSGAVLWRFTPPAYSSLAGSAQITTAAPVADPSRKAIYAAASDGTIRKLRVVRRQGAVDDERDARPDPREAHLVAQLLARARARDDRRLLSATLRRIRGTSCR